MTTNEWPWAAGLGAADAPIDVSVVLTREENGDVTVTFVQTSGTNRKVLFSHRVDVNHWISDVLNVTAHSERPGDFHAWKSHHMGEKDILEGRRGGY